jgi:hypothetical protein
LQGNEFGWDEEGPRGRHHLLGRKLIVAGEIFGRPVVAFIPAAIIDLWLLCETRTVSPGLAAARTTAWLLRLEPLVENRHRLAPQARAASVSALCATFLLSVRSSMPC